MPAITYVGPFDEIEIPDLEVTVKRGESFEASADDAKPLLAQTDNFEKSTTKSKDN